jgi:hypothetical protein
MYMSSTYPFVLIRPEPIETQIFDPSITAEFQNLYSAAELEVINKRTRSGPRDPFVVAETYDRNKTPAGWEPLLTFIDPRQSDDASPYPSAAVMYTTEMLTTDKRRGEHAAQCAKLAKQKGDICKLAAQIKCKPGEQEEAELKRKHDLLMKCSNLRAIENQTECVHDRNGIPTPLVPNEVGHAEEVINFSNGAQKCVEVFFTNRSKDPAEREKKYAARRAESQNRKDAAARGDLAEPTSKRQKNKTRQIRQESPLPRPRKAVHRSHQRERENKRRKGVRSDSKLGARRKPKRVSRRRVELYHKIMRLLGVHSPTSRRRRTRS